MQGEEWSIISKGGGCSTLSKGGDTTKDAFVYPRHQSNTYGAGIYNNNLADEVLGPSCNNNIASTI